MKTLKQLLTQPLGALPSSLVIIILILASAGFIDSVYLSVEHFMGLIPPCTIIKGCENVLTSSYSEFLGIPVALPGALYYLSIMIGSFVYIESKYVTKSVVHNSNILRLGLFLTIPGLLASLWFVGVQVFIIHSYCMYCIGSALITAALFVITLIVFKRFGTAGTI